MGVHYRPEPVGHWTPQQVTETYKPLAWDVTSEVSGPGRYRVTFQYGGGACRLGIESVELLANGDVVSADRHRGVTSASDAGNTYIVALKQRPRGTKYELRASARSEGGIDSHGDVFIERNPIAYSTDPNEVIQAKLCDHRQIDYWKRLVDEYQAHARWNAVVPLMVHQESHEMANSETLHLNSQQIIDNSADIMDELFKYVKRTGAVIVPAARAVAAYRDINPSTPPTYALVHDVTPTPAEKKEKDLFIYFDVNGQLFFDKGKDRSHFDPGLC